MQTKKESEGKSRREIAIEYFNLLKSNPTEKQAIKIIEYLDRLVYTESGNKISNQDKLLILNELDSIARSGIILEHSDNSAILNLIGQIKDEIQNRK